MFNFARTDAKSDCAERAVGCSVAVAADDRHARECATLFGADDMHDALVRVAHGVKRDAEIFGIGAHDVDLFCRDGVGDGQMNVLGRHIVIFGGHGEIRSAYPALADSQTVEGLGAGDLMDEVEIYIERSVHPVQRAPRGDPTLFGAGSMVWPPLHSTVRLTYVHLVHTWQA